MTQNNVDAAQVERHFDSLALSYDRIKNKNSYYHQSLIRISASVTGPGKRILDIGTGTGEILNALSPSEGIGIDLSSRMIEIAKGKFPSLRFYSGSYEKLDLGNAFDFILLIDVVEHLESPQTLFSGIKKFCNPDTRIMLTMANPYWEPFLHILEKLKLKMDEGPHLRISEKELLDYASRAGFSVESADTLVLLPVYIPWLTRFLNHRIARLPAIKNMALIKRYVFKETAALRQTS